MTDVGQIQHQIAEENRLYGQALTSARACQRVADAPGVSTHLFATKTQEADVLREQARFRAANTQALAERLYEIAKDPA